LDAIASKHTAEVAGMPLRQVRESVLLYQMALPGCRFIGGHFAYSSTAIDKFPEWQWITLLRHPVKRWISQYFFNSTKRDPHYRIKAGVEEFAASPQGRRLGFDYVRKLTGAQEDPDLHVDQAIDILSRFALVGTLENLPEFAGGYRRAFGPRLRIPHRNVNPASAEQRRAQVSPELTAEIARLCEPDLRVYRAVVQGFRVEDAPRRPER
jgi:hypothetical protein